MIPPRRLLLAGLAIAAFALAAIAVLLLSAPLWIDSDAVKRQITQLVERKTGSALRFERLRMGWMHPASVEIVRPSYRTDNLRFEAGSAVIGLDAWSLLSGTVRLRSVRISDASLSLQLPAAANDKPLTMAEVENRLRDVAAAITGAMPGLDASIRNATVAVQAPGQEALVLWQVDADLGTAGNGVRLNAQCRSVFWRRLSVELHLVSPALEGRGSAQFDGLDAAALARRLGMDFEWQPTDAELIGKLEWRMRGLARVDADLLAAAPRITLQGKPAIQAFEGATAAGAIEIRGTAFAVRLHRLYLRSPRALLAGEFSRDANGRMAFRIEGTDMDLVELQDAARNLVPEASWFADPPLALKAGTLQSLELQGSAEDFSGLLDPETLRGELSLGGLALTLKRPVLQIEDAGASVSFDQGELAANRISGRIGGSDVYGGRLSARLGEAPSLEGAEAFVNLDIGGAAALARRLVARRDVIAQLDALERIDGKALAHVRIARRPGGIEADVDVSQLALFVRHKFAPLPLRIEGGSLRYAKGVVAVSGAAGQFGQASFRGLDASIELASPNRFQVRQQEGRIVLEELETALRQFPAAAQMLREIRGVTGTATVTDAIAAGDLAQPEAARFEAMVSLQGVKLFAAKLGADVLLEGGPIHLSERAVDIRDLGVRAMDSALRIRARTEDYRKGLDAIEAGADGEIGPATLQRLQADAGIPAQFRLRPPLRLSDVSAAWKRNGDLSLRGGFNLAGRTDLSLVAQRSQGKVLVRDGKLRDAASNAAFSGEFLDRNLDIAFKGRLSGETVAAVFVQPPLALQGIEGDLTAGLHLGKPWLTHAQGELAGRRIEIPDVAGATLRVEDFSLSAGNGRISVQRATGAHGDNRIEFKGEVWREDDKVVIDADLKSDRIVLPKSRNESESVDKKPFRLSDLAVTGRLDLDIGRLETDLAVVTPLVAEVSLAGDRMDLRIIQAAMCDIGMSGTLRGTLENAELTGSLSARDIEVEESIACLTGGRVVLSGRLDVAAQFTAAGPLVELAKRLDGGFSATARDGRIEQFDTLNRIFAFLNLTELVRGERLGMDGRGLPYRTARLKGGISGTGVHLEESELDAATVYLAATGKVDYGKQEVAMDVLVAPLQTANVIINKIPLVNRIFGGAVLALPVRVSGPVTSPLILPLGPGAVTRRMSSIIANTLKLPLDGIKAVTPGAGTDATSDAPQ